MTKAVGRVYFTSLIQGELYYLRILLYNIRGPTSYLLYEYLRTYSDTIYNTFHAACGARGLIEMDDEWDRCLEETASFQTGSQFHQLFVTLLLMNNPFDPLALFDRHFQVLSDECRYLLQYCFHIDSSTNQAIISLTLQKLADILEKAGKSLQDYKLPLPSVTLDELNGIPRMMAQELTYDRALLARRWDEGVVASRNCFVWSESMTFSVIDTSTYIKLVEVEIPIQPIRCNTWTTSLYQNPITRVMKFQFQPALYYMK